MESTTLHTLRLPLTPFSSSSPHRYRRSLARLVGVRKRQFTAVSASKRDAYGRDYNGKLVDESMIVLRKRIQEMKIVERDDNDETPENWMEWEKQAYKSYDSDICEAVGLLQTQLMNTRPCLVLAIVVFITFSVAMSILTIAFHFMELAKVLLAGL